MGRESSKGKGTHLAVGPYPCHLHNTCQHPVRCLRSPICLHAVNISELCWQQDHTGIGNITFCYGHPWAVLCKLPESLQRVALTRLYKKLTGMTDKALV